MITQNQVNLIQNQAANRVSYQVPPISCRGNNYSDLASGYPDWKPADRPVAFVITAQVGFGGF